MDPYKSKNLDTDISIEGKVSGLINFVTECKFGMMTTRERVTGMLVSRCMAIAGTENGIDLIFHTNLESGKADDLNNDPHINIACLKDTDWASISGTAEIVQDTEEVKRYYNSGLKAWVGDLGDGVHDGSAKDPRLAVIKVRTHTATYAIAHASSISRTLEVAKGAITGNVASVNILREVGSKDVELWRRSKELVA
ncbi:hypothetical protein H072_5508 [Dactylellina haptotyla CBS 200.50]|uniref:General stress protein FMN-binding split barrel domain-containing protein n=1 Tax=Dactylellina haptotyla (strain CBS 200.50) TaxID=1284197 RepID=S8ACA7_DACHA|nr:hypothetical protein H072_5508 [Dactylellina haptotyla CBS 200.50]